MSDVDLLANFFENFIKVSIKELDNIHLYYVSLPGYTWQCGMKYTDNNLQTIQHRILILLFQSNIRGGISLVIEDGYVKTEYPKKMLYIDANTLYGLSMSQPLHMMKLNLMERLN